jgi:large subunit ribosomal protein L24
MKKKYSSKWISSKQPRKQRKYRANAPLHVRQKMASSHLAKDLRGQYKRRSAPIRKGDEVRVMSGEPKGKYGKVERVDLKSMRVFVENIKARKANGQEMPVAIDPSNILILKIGSDDKKRFASLGRKLKAAEKDVKIKK